MPRKLVRPTVIRKRILLLLGWYSPAIHRGVAKFAREANWILDSQAARYGRLPAEWRGDGIICMLAPEGPYNDFIAGSDLPTVNLSWRGPHVHVPSVLHDDGVIGQMGANHFLERRFEHLAFYRAESLWVAKDRQAAFEAAVQAHCKRVHSLIWTARYRKGPLERHLWLVDQIKLLPKPLGIMAQNDDYAVELLDACEAAHIAVPEKVAILGCDNDELPCELAAVPLSSIDSNLEGLGFEAAAILQRLMSGRDVSPVTLIPPRNLIVRKSSDVLAVANPNVAAALNFIREHYWEPIGVDEILDASGTSRRGLYYAFSRHLGRTIAQELIRRRIEEAKRLLVKGDVKLQKIASACGFSSAEHLSKVFHREVGISAAKYRKTRQQKDVLTAK